MQPPLSRRSLLRASGPALAAALAGCSLTDGQETDTPPRTTPKPDGPDPVTTTEIQTDALPTTTPERTPTPTTERCRSGPLEPTVSDGEALLYHQRHKTGTALFDQSTTVFEGTYDLDVTAEMIPNAAFLAVLQSSVPSEDGPELFQWPHDRVGSFLDASLVVDQSEALRVDSCQYTDAAWAAAQFQGKTVGLPFAAETVALYYHENLVDAPPETFAEMQSVMDEFHDPENSRYGLEIPPGPYHASGFAQAYGGEIYDGEADELGLTSDGVERGLRVFFEEVAPYMPRQGGEYEDIGRFETGDAAFTIDGPWRLEDLEDSDVEWGVTTLPTLPDGGEMRPYMGVKLLYFSTRVVEDLGDGAVAREFAEWYTTDTDRLRRLAETARYAPVHAELVGDPDLPEPMRVFSEQCERGYPMPTNPKMDQVWGPFGDSLQRVHTDEAGLTEALRTAEKRIREQWAESED